MRSTINIWWYAISTLCWRRMARRLRRSFGCCFSLFLHWRSIRFFGIMRWGIVWGQISAREIYRVRSGEADSFCWCCSDGNACPFFGLRSTMWSMRATTLPSSTMRRERRRLLQHLRCLQGRKLPKNSRMIYIGRMWKRSLRRPFFCLHIIIRTRARVWEKDWKIISKNAKKGLTRACKCDTIWELPQKSRLPQKNLEKSWKNFWKRYWQGESLVI